MRITQAELDRYREQVKSRQDDAYAYVIARLQNEAQGLPVDEARDAAIEIIEDGLAVYGDQAQAVSAAFFDEVCQAEGIDADPGQMFDGIIDASKLASKVRYYAGKLVDGDWGGYAGSNADLAAYYVHRSAFENMERNCYENEVRYARVGTGRETCGFCFMLCSRGFDYRSKDSASAASHVNCDCIIVPGVDGVTKIQGYEPEKMRERWNSCRDTLGGDKALRADFNALSKEELAKIKGKSKSEKWTHYRNHRINDEVETRDTGWLYRGIEPTIDYSLKPREQYGVLKKVSSSFNPSDYNEGNFTNKKDNEWADLFAHDALKHNGFDLKTFDGQSIDVTINGDWWEIKSGKKPKKGDSKPSLGHEYRFIEDEVRKAVAQFENRGMPNDTRVVFNPRYKGIIDFDVAKKEFFRQCENHKVKDGLFIYPDGRVSRLP